MATGGRTHHLARFLIFFNFLLYLVVIGLCSWIYNNNIVLGDRFTSYFLTLALIAGVVGTASFFSGLPLLQKSWATETVSAAAAVGFLALSLSFLALGFASKEIDLGNFFIVELRVLEGFVISVTITQLLYVVLLSRHMFD